MARGMRGTRRRWVLRGTLVAGTAVTGLVLGSASGAWAATPDATTADEACAVSVDASAPTVCFGSTAEAVEYVTGEEITDPAALADNRTALERIINRHNEDVADRAPVLRSLVGALLGGSVPSVGGATPPASPQVATATLAAPRATTLAATPALPILGAVWKDKNYEGKVAVLYAASGNGCGNGSTYGFPHTSSFGMQDNITSVASYSSCAMTLYKDANYKGTSRTIQIASPNIGSPLNDEVSSIVFRPQS